MPTYVCLKQRATVAVLHYPAPVYDAGCLLEANETPYLSPEHGR
jgi:hypothetical protein